MWYRRYQAVEKLRDVSCLAASKFPVNAKPSSPRFRYWDLLANLVIICTFNWNGSAFPFLMIQRSCATLDENSDALRTDEEFNVEITGHE